MLAQVVPIGQIPGNGHRLGIEEAEPLLTPGLAAACILDIDLMGVEGVWAIERLRRRARTKAA